MADRSVTEKLGVLARQLATVAACAVVVYRADVLGVMMYSKRVSRPLLYLSLLLFASLMAIWAFTALVLARRNSNWEVAHPQLIKTAAIILVAGSALWTLALWSVFHIWTMPLGFCIFTAFLNVVGVCSSGTKRKTN